MAHPEIQEIIAKMPSTFQASSAGDLDAVLQFNLSGDKSGDFYATIKNGSCTATEGKHASPTTTFNLAGQDWLDLTQGKADGMSLFMQGKLSVEGDMGLAMRMGSLFKQ
ncbi:SCP2 sterol-binding domain-containing protein [Candidatus Sumerlaeota bacterium]|nr:SCP2 sterol-binding domain-containing protein [Candidatus Sumerlaeota bacterium]